MHLQTMIHFYMEFYNFSNVLYALLSDSSFWYKHAQTALHQKLKSVPINEKVAKNVILFLGDGMSMATITASRVFKGQIEGSQFGEEAEMVGMMRIGNLYSFIKNMCFFLQNFESFPHVGLMKVSCFPLL